MARVDFYLVLGVKRSATVAELRRAYKRLARRYHPDINPGDREAAAFYQVLTEAYETLRDPGRREAYDSRGADAMPPGGKAPPATVQFQGFDFSPGGRGGKLSATFTDLFAEVLPHPAAEPETRGGAPERGSDLVAEIELTFEEAIRGVEQRLTVRRLDSCGPCGGTGRRRGAEARCATCRGDGTLQWHRGHMLFSTRCGDCRGSGRLRYRACGSCDARGVVEHDEEITVQVPPGVDDGTRLRVRAKGNAGLRGGAPGDLYLVSRVQAHAHFRRDGTDLRLELPIAIHEAILGAAIDVPTLDGTATLDVPAGTTSEQDFRMAGHGVPDPQRAGHRGDLIVTVRVVLPTVSDERSRMLLREFGELHRNDVRQDMFRKTT